MRDIETSRELSYGAVGYTAATLAQVLRPLEVQARVVALRLTDPMLYAAAIVACWECGAAAAILDPSSPLDKQQRQWSIAAPAAYICDDDESGESSRTIDARRIDSRSASPPITMRALGAEAPALILFSSGSTGEPKCVPLSFRNITSNVIAFNERLDITGADVFLSVSPLWYAHGLYNAVLTALILGSHVVYHRALSLMTAEAILRDARDCGATVFHATPSMLAILSLIAGRTSEPLPAFRWVIAGTARLPARDKESFERLFHVPVTQQYGMTETLFMAVNHDHQVDKPASVGRPVGCVVEVRGEDGGILGPGHTGELFARSTAAFGSYYRQGDETAAAYVDGWFRTGDLGGFDDDGCLTITGRRKDIIKKAGFAIAPQEIDNVVMMYPGVIESATIGAPDELYGEEVYTFAAASSDVSEEDVLAHCRAHLRRTHLPKRIFLSAGLPKTVSGKIKKHELEALLKGMLNGR